MKIAGRKNNGAWARANKLISKLGTDEEKENLAGSIAASDFIDGAYNALITIQERTGITLEGISESKDAWATQMVTSGIPSQIWFGLLSWAPYDKVGTGKSAKYTKSGEAAIRLFGQDIRKKVTQYFMARRLFKDAFDIGGRNEGNPGGDPDGNPDS